MTRAVFDWVESPGTNRDNTVRMKRSQLGDGYVQEAPDGLNPVDRVYNIVIRGCDKQVAADIEAFLDANAGLLIDWNPIWSTTTVPVIATQWSRSQGEVWGETDISIRFERRYVP